MYVTVLNGFKELQKTSLIIAMFPLLQRRPRQQVAAASAFSSGGMCALYLAKAGVTLWQRQWYAPDAEAKSEYWLM